MHACVPYFLSCAGALLVARRRPSSQALPLSCAWALLVIVGTYAAFCSSPMYAQASTWAWALWRRPRSAGLREAHVIRGIEGGLDVFAAPRRLPDEPGDAGESRNSTTLR